MKKALIAIGRPVLELLAEGINPTELIKPVLLEVEQPQDPKDFIMNVPDAPPDWPKDLPDNVWQVVMAMQAMGLKIFRIHSGMEHGRVTSDEIIIDSKSGLTGYVTIWREDSGHQHKYVSCSVKSTTGHWIRLGNEMSLSVPVLLRKLNYMVNVVAPKVRIHGDKRGARQAQQIMTRFRNQVGEAKTRLDGCKIEDQLIEIARTIRHCGDYGTLYYHPGKKEVHWTAADSDGSGDNCDYTPLEDIERMLTLPGITHVEIGDEWSPDEDEGWVRLRFPSEPDEDIDEAVDLVFSRLCESPRFKTLKASRQSLSAEEKQEAGDAPIWKATIDGTTWYVSNTHRCFQADKTIKDAVSAYRVVVEPSG